MSDGIEERLTNTILLIPSTKIPVDKIILDPSNPNEMTDQQLLGLEKFMIKHGFAVELWVNQNKDNTYLCIDGEHRVKVLQKNNIKSVYAKIFHVKPHEVKMMRQIANKLHGTHDKNKDAIEYKEIFDAGELDELADILDESVEDFENILEKNFEDISFEREEIDDTPLPPAEPTSKLGDIYQLGNHRIMCGDCTNENDCKKLFAGAEINGLQTDPPYGVDYASKNEFLNEMDKGNRIQTGYKNDDVTMDYRKFAGDFLKLVPFAEYNTIYVWTSGIRTLELRQAFEDAKITYSQTINWVKNNHVLSRLDYHPKHESCLYGWKGRHKFYGGTAKMSVLFYNKPLVNDLHPTMKPVELIVQLIKDGTKKGDNVYDAFLGSGTTLIACEQTDRICFGMELEPSYVDVIIQRFINYVGSDKDVYLIKNDQKIPYSKINKKPTMKKLT